jgi:hypothetical protein
MLKLFPTNHLALTDTLYAALNNVRAFRSILERIRCSKSSKLFGQKKIYIKK